MKNSKQLNTLQRLIILMGFIFMISCSHRNENGQVAFVNDLTDNQNENFLGILNQIDTLKIVVEFDECGEWGGHKESIFLKENMNHEAQLIIDSVSCDNIGTFYDNLSKHYYSDIDDKTRIVIIKKEKILTNKDKQIISDFIKGLLEIYLARNYYRQPIQDTFTIYMDSGTWLNIINTDSTFNLTVWNIDNYANTNYSKVRDLIFNKTTG